MLFSPSIFESTMKMNSCKILICAVSFSILFLALPGHAENGTLKVKCAEASGNPVQNAKVVVFGMNTEKSKEKKSDAQGLAEFAKLEDGAYRVFARKEGFAPALYEFVSLKGSTESVTLNFTAGADKKLYFEDPEESKRAGSLLQQGLEAFKGNKFEDAEKLFAQALEINPSIAEGIYYYGAAFMQQGKFDQAAEMFNRAAKISDVLKATIPADPSGSNTYEKVSQSAKRLLNQMPALRGEYAMRQKDYDAAIKAFSEAIKSDPKNPEYHANLAIALTNAGKIDEALASMDQAIQLKPDEKTYPDYKAKISARKENAIIEKANAVLLEGNKLLQDGNAAEALKKYEESRSMIAADKQAPIWMQIGKAHAKLNQQDEAIAAFKKSIELAPAKNMGDYRKAFAQFYLDARRYDEAIDVLSDPNTSQNSEQTLQELAKTWKNKEPNFAAAALEKIIKLNPENAEAHFELGQLYYIEGKSKDSRTKEILTKYLELEKNPEQAQRAKDLMIIISKRSK
jgi:tetratricopeptide (TPR) repeat protein